VSDDSSDSDPDSALTHVEARAVLLEIAESEALKEEFSLVSDSCTSDDLKEIVDLAWRHQFEDDRSGFKKDIKKLQEHVCDRAMENSE
jgi:hypothetical protein